MYIWALEKLGYLKKASDAGILDDCDVLSRTSTPSTPSLVSNCDEHDLEDCSECGFPELQVL